MLELAYQFPLKKSIEFLVGTALNLEIKSGGTGIFIILKLPGIQHISSFLLLLIILQMVFKNYFSICVVGI
jgi:hypothetical protein